MIKETCEKIWQTTQKNVVLTVVIALAIVVIVVGAISYELFFNNTAEAVGQKAIDFINENYLQDSGIAELGDAVEFSGMYRITFKIIAQGQEQEQVAYITKDGKYLFPEMMDIPINLEQKIDVGAEETNNEVTSCEQMKKSESPTVQAFVISQCPYGVQMQRVLSKLVTDQPNTKGNVIVRYFGSIEDGKIIAMHGDQEAQENLRQICLREETNKYWPYIACYMKEGKSDDCLTSAGVNKSALTSCMTDANKGLEYAKVDFALADQYSVEGSPTLIVDGDKVDEFSFGGRTVDALKTIICCASNSQPAYCSQVLSKDSAAASFSTTYTSSSDANASCGE